MLAKHTLKNNFRFFLLMVVCGTIISANAATPATDVIEPAEPLSTATESPSVYEYALEGRSDPFVPFLSSKASMPQLDPDEIIDEDIELTGMRQFEPGQLTLVAVMETSDHKVAMVEDVTGKGYILSEGISIGRRGVVTQIYLQQVLITETARTRAGKEIQNTIVMRLNKEGEQ